MDMYLISSESVVYAQDSLQLSHCMMS